ncbi:TadE/TadG family type IV pilus assembly protein [Rhizobium sp. T1470]|uniref:TadE/TadG family type IV pilus assembly protein n=1 Tax=unclassified Rhizobium TaxID=2613769 RepID=UPI001AAF0A1F|nr:TadE/TadG family type IV pilus assembly protein [Rhizobium sp. T1473]MCA0803258.1 pilus assembly protein TadG-related protein [Rhizobium sp. T1473]
MSTLRSLKSSLSRLRNDRHGNFGIISAILLPVTIGAGALAVDITNAAMAKHQLQEASDAAALATAAALADGKINTTTAAAFAKDFVAGQMANFIRDTTALRDATTATATKTTSNGGTSYSVSVSSSYSMDLSGLAQVIGFKTTNIGAGSQTSSGYSEKQGSVSIFLALDKSGSMGDDTTTTDADTPTESYTYNCDYHWNDKGKWTNKCTGTRTNYYTKIEALKLAVGNLTTELDKADPTHIYSRTGAVSYDLITYPETKLAWGTSAVTTYVNALSAANGTNSSGAVSMAYGSLMAKNNAGNDNENALHQAKTGQTPKKYIVFMTDGDNNNDTSGGRSYDTLTKATCDKAKGDGIEIYTVAFMAPTNGQALLKYCATDDNHYFKAESMSDLLAAFQEIGAKTSDQKTRLIN